jgi:L,D-transpeptidase ErfK/SrfK
MTTSRNNKINRRSLLGYAAVALVAPSVVRAETIRRNISTFRVHDWQDHFDTLGKGIIISDTVTMALQHWTADGEMRIYPTSVPLTDELTKRG